MRILTRKIVVAAFLTAILMSEVDRWNVAWAGDGSQENNNQAEVLLGESLTGCTTNILDPSFPSDAQTKRKPSYLYSWFTFVAPVSTSAAQPEFAKKMEEVKGYFTEQGWNEFSEFLAVMGYKDFFLKYNSTAAIRSFLTTAPVYVSQGMITDESNNAGYRIIFRISLQSSFSESGNLSEKVNHLFTSIVVMGDGIPKIESWRADPYNGDRHYGGDFFRKSYVWKKVRL